MPSAILDTGPLISWLDRAERHHRWATDRLRELNKPLLVCEPVLAEAAFLLRRFSLGPEVLFRAIESGTLRLAFRMEEHVPALHTLLQKYRDRPMSIADACILRMAEIYDRHSVLTLDSDFSVYRKHGRIPLTVIRPAMG
jgi:predicted nucleic acid-binding protein